MDDRQLVADAFAAWSRLERPVTDLFADDMTWEITGSSAASRSYPDKAAFVSEVLAPFARRFGEADPFRPVRVRSVLHDPEARTVVVVWDGRGTTVAGTVYENTYAWVMRLRDGLVVAGTAFYDSPAFDVLWDLEPRPAVDDAGA